MKITLRTASGLDHLLPQPADGDTALVTLADKATVAEAMTGLGLDWDGKYLVTVNGALVPVRDRRSRRLSSGDDLGVFPPLAGG